MMPRQDENRPNCGSCSHFRKVRGGVCNSPRSPDGFHKVSSGKRPRANCHSDFGVPQIEGTNDPTIDEFMGKVITFACQNPGQAQYEELVLCRKLILQTANYLADQGDLERNKTDADTYNAAAGLLWKAADKVLCLHGTFDFRELIGAKRG